MSNLFNKLLQSRRFPNVIFETDIIHCCQRSPDESMKTLIWTISWSWKINNNRKEVHEHQYELRYINWTRYNSHNVIYTQAIYTNKIQGFLYFNIFNKVSRKAYHKSQHLRHEQEMSFETFAYENNKIKSKQSVPFLFSMNAFFLDILYQGNLKYKKIGMDKFYHILWKFFGYFRCLERYFLYIYMHCPSFKAQTLSLEYHSLRSSTSFVGVDCIS